MPRVTLRGLVVLALLCLASAVTIIVPCCKVSDIAAAVAGAASSDSIQLTTGTYTGCSQQITRFGGLVLDGQGSVIDCLNNVASGIVVNITHVSATDCSTITNLSLQNFTGGSAFYLRGVLPGSGTVSLASVSFTKGGNSGAYGGVVNSRNVTVLVTDAVFTSVSSRNVFYVRTGNLTITRGTFSKTTGTGTTGVPGTPPIIDIANADEWANMGCALRLTAVVISGTQIFSTPMVVTSYVGIYMSRVSFLGTFSNNLVLYADHPVEMMTFDYLYCIGYAPQGSTTYMINVNSPTGWPEVQGIMRHSVLTQNNPNYGNLVHLVGKPQFLNVTLSDSTVPAGGSYGSGFVCDYAVYTNCTFLRNTRLKLISFQQGAPVGNVSGCYFERNEMDTLLNMPTGQGVIEYSIFRSNTAYSRFFYSQVYSHNSLLRGNLFYDNNFSRDTNCGLLVGGASYNSRIVECTFINNRGGGAYFKRTSGNTDLVSCVFTNNTVTTDAGLIFASEATSFTSCTFTGNSATNGGAILVSSAATVTNCVLQNNTAALGGAIFGYHGGRVTVTGTTFIGNSATSGGGAIYMDQSTLVTSGARSYFIANSAPTGGAVYVGASSTVQLNQGNLTGNIALTGGAFYVTSGPMLLQNSLLSGNRATVDGGCIYATASVTVYNSIFSGCVGQNGGAISQRLGTLNLTNSVLTQNIGYNGAALYASSTTTAVIKSTVITQNSASVSGGGIYWQAQGQLDVAGGAFNDNTAGSAGGGMAVGLNTNVRVNATIFNSNFAGGYGGACDVGSGSVTTFNDCAFSYNQAGSGGVLSTTSSTTVTINRGTLTSNNATSQGGAIYSASASATVILTGSNCTNNYAVRGGAIYTAGALIVTGLVTWSANNASQDGGAIDAIGGSVSLSGGVQLLGNAARRGAGIACSGCFLNLTHTSFIANNASSRGAAVYCAAGVATLTAQVASNVVFRSNFAAREPALEANCTACGCCDYGPTVVVTPALRCVLFGGISNCSYNCSVGYNISDTYGGAYMCPANGLTLDDLPLLCFPIACPVLHAPTNGLVSIGATPHTPDFATYECNEGYQFNDTATVQPQCIGPNWITNGYPPQCTPLPCQQLAPLTNGDATSLDGAHGENVTLTCHQGYFFSVDATLVSFSMNCTLGKWSSIEPSCIAGACPELVAPVFGVVVATGRTTGETAQYICNEGYALVGAEFVSCVSPAWDHVAPVCQAIQCPTLGAPQNGLVANGAGSMTTDIATYTCSAGFAVIGPQTLRCVGPHWRQLNNDPLPANTTTTCEPVTCPPLALPLNTSAECYDTLPYNARCAVGCIPGYEGPRYNVRCQQDSGDLTSRDGLLVVVDASTPAPCSICPAGQYSEDGLKCLDCPNAVTYARGAPSLATCECVAGYYEQPPLSGFCVACPTGGLCLGSRQQPVAASGFFYAGGSYITCYPSEACQTNNTCATGYTGYTCGLCVSGYFKLNGHCEVCPVPGYWKILVAGLCGGLALLILIPIARPSSRNEFSTGFGSIPIVLSFVQTTAIFVDLRLPWPRVLRSIMDGFSALNLNVELMNPECAAELSFYDKYILQLAVPLGVLVWFVLFALLHISVTALCLRGQASRLATRASQIAWDVAGGYMLFLSLAYILVARASFSLFSCKAQADGVWVLAFSQGDACYTETWRKHVPLAVAAIIVYTLGIPCLFLGAAAWRRVKRGASSAALQQPTAFYVKPYEASSWYWECVVMLRKVLVVAIALFLIDQLISAIILISAVLFVSAIGTAVLQPYRWDGHDVVDFASLLGCLGILFSGLVVNSPVFTAIEVAEGIAVALAAITLVVCLACFLYEVLVNARAYWRSRRVANPVYTETLDDRSAWAGIVADGNCTVAVSRDGKMVVFDGVETVDVGEPLVVKTSDVTSVVAAGTGSIVVLDSDAKCHLVKTTTGEHTPILNGTSVVAVAAFEGVLVAVDENGHVTAYRLDLGDGANRKRAGRLRKGKQPASDDGSSSSSDSIASASSSDDHNNTKLMWERKGLGAPVAGGLFVHGHTVVYCTRTFGIVQLNLKTAAIFGSWQIVTGKSTDDDDVPTCVCMFGAHIAVGTKRGLLHILSTETGHTRTLSLHTHAITAAAHWQGHLLTTSLDGTLRVWNVELGLRVFTLHSPGLGYSCLAVNSDRLYAGTIDGILSVHDLAPKDTTLSLFTPTSPRLFRCCKRHSPGTSTLRLCLSLCCRFSSHERDNTSSSSEDNASSSALHRLLAPMEVLEAELEEYVHDLESASAPTQLKALAGFVERLENN